MEKQLETIIKNQDIKGLNELIEKGLDISEIKLVEVFKSIYNIKKNVNPKQKKENLENSLNTEFIKTFIENGADIEYSEYTKNETWVHDDITYKRTKKKVLLSCFQFAFWFSDKELIKYFLEQGADVNQKFIALLHSNDMFDTTPLKTAYHYADTEMMQYLMSKGAKIDTKVPSEDGELAHYEANKLLLESGVNPDQFGIENTTVISGLSSMLKDKYHQLFSKKDKDYAQELIKEIKLFVQYGAEVNGGCPINDILTSPYIKYDEIWELYSLFLDAGLDVNCKDIKGNTPLLEAYSVLLPKKADYVFEFDEKDTLENNNRLLKADLALKIICSLVNNGADINAKNNMGMTVLMMASFENKTEIVELFLLDGADINIKSEMTALDLTSDEKIKKMIEDSRNHTPQKLVKILTNFTLDKPIKFTTHTWDFGSLKKEYTDFDGYMEEVAKQFNSFGMMRKRPESEKSELEALSPSLHKKIYTFLLDTDPDENYSWCSKVHINIGWSSLEGLEEWCNNAKDPFDFTLPKPIRLDRRTKLTKFGEVIELFKQEIETRRDFKNLTTVFERINDNLGNDFNLSTQKLVRQFYTDVEKVTSTLDKIFDSIKKHSDYKDIEVIANEFEDGTIELRITQVGSPSTLSAEKLFAEVDDGDFADIKASLTNLCDWSVEGSFEESHFRINYLKSNNVKDIVELDGKPAGFTYILRFYKK